MSSAHLVLLCAALVWWPISTVFGITAVPVYESWDCEGLLLRAGVFASAFALFGVILWPPALLVAWCCS